MHFRHAVLLLLCYRFALIYVSAAESYSLSGRIVNEVSGAPISRALVEFVCFVKSGNPSEQSSPIQKQVFTDAAGTFAVSSLAESGCMLSAEKPGYQREQLSESIKLGPSRDNILLKLRPLNSVEGFVTDSGGRPLQGLQINAVSLSYVEGRRHLTILRSVSTDDRGYYRLWNLQDGKLFLKASGRSGGNTLYMTERAPSFVAYESFAPVYYGGASRIAEATPLSFTNGQEQKADFRLSLQPAFRIRGSISNLQPYKPAKIELFSSNEDIAANRSSLNALTGKFEVYDVAPGTYRLRITQGEATSKVLAETQVEVSTSDISGVQLQATTGVDIPIQLTQSGTPSVEQASFSNSTQKSANRRLSCHFRLQSEMDERQRHDAIYSADGIPERFSAVLPGEYSLYSVCYGGYFSSFMFGLNDVMGAKKIIVQAGVPPPPLTLHFHWGGGQIELDRPSNGTSLPPRRLMHNTEQILLVPSFPTAEGVRLMKNTGDRFAPGDYTLHWLKDDLVPYSDASFVATLRNGLSIRVNEGQVTHVAIKDLIK